MRIGATWSPMHVDHRTNDKLIGKLQARSTCKASNIHIESGFNRLMVAAATWPFSQATAVTLTVVFPYCQLSHHNVYEASRPAQAV